jgi:peptide/nickel transport system substrate-binding protein
MARSVALFLALLTALAVAACNAAPSPPTASQPSSATAKSTPLSGERPAAASPTEAPRAAAPPIDTNARIRLAVRGLTPTLDPHNSSTPVTAQAQYAVFDTLMRIGGKGLLAPSLAESWTVVTPTQWRIKLKPNVTFHNGERLTSETVKWNLERIANPENRLGFISDLASMDRVQVVDPLTVDIFTKTPNPQLPTRLRLIGLIPHQYFQQVGFDQFIARPVGTGAFQAISFEGGNKFVGTRFEGYHGAKPQFKDVEILALTEPVVRLAALRSGQVDVIEAVAPSDYAEVRRDFTTSSTLTGSAQGVFLDLVTVQTPLNNRNVRLALNYDTDRDSMIATFGGGLAIPVGQFAHPDTFGYNPAIKAYPFDPARAKSLMQEAGFANGFTMKMHVLASTDALAGMDVAQFLQASWRRDLNVTLELEPVDVNRYLQMSQQGGFNPMRLASQGFGSDAAGAQQRYRFDGEPNAARRLYHNPEFDRVYNQMLTEFDQNKRDELVQLGSKILFDDAAHILISITSSPWAMVKQIDNMRTDGDGQVIWQNIVRYTSAP